MKSKMLRSLFTVGVFLAIVSKTLGGEGFPAGFLKHSRTQTKSSSISTLSKHELSENYGKLPLQFEVNQGQADRRVKFLCRGNRHTLFLTATEAVLLLPGE